MTGVPTSRKLAALQKQLHSYVLTGAARAAAHVVGTRSVPASTRLKIYREAYYLRLAEALGTSYPVLLKFLAEDEFRVLARDYIEAHPSRHYSVRFFGHRLAAFLSATQPYGAMPLLSEIARWEWAMAAVFDARDADPVKRQALQQISPPCWPALRFRMHSAIRVVNTLWNTAAIWSALNRDESRPDLIRNPARQRWMIWRTDLEVFFAEIPQEEERALRAARRGEPFARICACAPTDAGDAGAALWAAKLLHQWIARGWIVAVVGA